MRTDYTWFSVRAADRVKERETSRSTFIRMCVRSRACLLHSGLCEAIDAVVRSIDPDISDMATHWNIFLSLCIRETEKSEQRSFTALSFHSFSFLFLSLFSLSLFSHFSFFGLRFPPALLCALCACGAKLGKSGKRMERIHANSGNDHCVANETRNFWRYICAVSSAHVKRS